MSLPWTKLAGIVVLAAAASAGVRRPVPVAHQPWAFLDASGEIAETSPLSVFRGAVEGDLDLDGDLDVVVAQAFTAAGVDGTPARGVLLMNEGGRFVDRTAALMAPLAASEVRWFATVHDFAGPAGPPDGWPDVFLPGGGGGPSRFLMNQGRDAGGAFLGFQEAQARIVGSPLTTASHSYHSVKADFDGNGLMDLLVFQYKPNLGFGQTRILINDDGFLVDETATRLPARSEPSLFGQAADLNGDLAPDIALTNLKNGLVPGVPASVPSVRVLINDGSGGFPPQLEQVMPERLSPQSGFGAYALEAADFNGDQRRDLYVINWGMAGNMARDGVLLNLGSGNQLFTQVAYPVISGSSIDNDGDHPVAADLDNDGRLDVVVAQFSSRPFFLYNESLNGQLRLVERTPPEVPSTLGFRCKVFDANGDGKSDVWLAMRARNHLIANNVLEREPNDDLGSFDRTLTLPALRTGWPAGPDDRDLFRLPPAALAAGARVVLRPSPQGDLRLNLLDAGGGLVASSEQPGNGVAEVLDVPAGGGLYLGVERQGAQGGDMYRLEILRTGALITAPRAPRPDPRSRLPRTWRRDSP